MQEQLLYQTHHLWSEHKPNNSMEWTKGTIAIEPEYGTDNKYNSYEPEYGTDYGMDSYDKKPYGKDNSYDKSKDSSSAFVKKVKCNNINVNVNGDIDIGASQALSGLATDDEAQAADEGEVGANTLGNGSVEAMVVDHQVLTATLDLYV